MDVVASLSRDSKIGPVRVNHKVSTTGDDTRKKKSYSPKHVVSMLVPTFNSNMGFPLYVTLYPHFFVSGNIGAHL